MFSVKSGQDFNVDYAVGAHLFVSQYLGWESVCFFTNEICII